LQTISLPGKIVINKRSFVFIYNFLFVIMGVLIGIMILYEVLTNIMTRKMDLHDAFSYGLVLSVPILNVILAITIFESKKTADFINDWKAYGVRNINGLHQWYELLTESDST